MCSFELTGQFQELKNMFAGNGNEIKFRHVPASHHRDFHALPDANAVTNLTVHGSFNLSNMYSGLTTALSG